MRRILYFNITTPQLALELLESISQKPLIGDPRCDTTIYGVVRDNRQNQLIWAVGWGGGEGYEWAMIEWDSERPPLPNVIRDFFSIIDEPEIDGRLEEGYIGDQPHILV